MSVAGNQLQLSFGVNAPESRTIFTDTKLPDGKPVGVRLDGYVDYANLVYTGSTTSGTQSWTSTTDVTLTNTNGTLYAYYPQSSSVSIDAIDVDMTAADQTDWLYATPVTDVNEDKASVAVTMNHALANINVKVNKGTYKGDGNITNITVQSDGIALGGTFNAAQATPGYTAFEDEGKPLSRTVTTTAGAAATDIMVVPTGTSAAITFLLTIDDIQFTAKSDAVQLVMGNSYQYTLNLSDISTYMEISTFAVKPWVTIMDSNPIQLDKYDPYKDYVQVIYNVENTGTKTSLLSSPGVTHYYNNVPYTFSLATVEEMIVDGQSVEPTISHTFESAGYHKVCYKFKNNTIPDVCFKGHTNIIDIKLPDNIVGLGSVALAECTGLTEITIPESVTRIGDYTFDECTGLTAVTIPNSVTYIGQYAFKSCSGVKTMTLGAGLTGIGSYAFSELGALRIIKLLATTAPSIRNNSFKTVRSGGLLIVPSGCTDAYATWMSTSSYYLGYNYWVCLEEGNYVFEDGIYYSADGKTILANDGSLSGTLSIKEGVETIGDYAFYKCSGLTQVIIPNSVISIGRAAFYECRGLKGELIIPNLVTDIGQSAFSGCTGLTEIKLPDSLTSIGQYAFNSCTGLTEVTIPNSVTSIGQYAFYQCTGLTEITIPNSVTSIGERAFSSCYKLMSITSLATIAPSIQSSTFTSVKSGGTLIVPNGCTDAYASWMSTGNYYLGKYNWTIQEMTE